MRTKRDNKLGYWQVAAIGVGGMVGGGIFAVLGLAVQLARGGTPIAFLCAGGIALVTAHSYANLSAAYRDEGGTVTFLNRTFGTGIGTGALNLLLWLSYIVMLSLYARAFGSYGASLIPGAGPLTRHLLTSIVVLAITGLNTLGSRAIGEAEEWIVLVKLAILLGFVSVGVFGIQPGRMAPDTWSSGVELLAGGMIIFLAYEGFELIANAAPDVRDPARTLPRAYYTSVAFVAALYVLVAAVTVGNLTLDRIAAARDYALAEAAKPFLGQAGFTLIAIAALLSTASAINASLYGAARLSYIIARDGELPAGLERKIWSKPLEGLLITAGATLVLANSLDLSGISTLGSAGFLIVFAGVNWAAVRLARRGGERGLVSAVGAVACTAALAALVWQRASTAPADLWILMPLLVLAFGIEIAYRAMTGREIRLGGAEGGSGSG